MKGFSIAGGVVITFLLCSSAQAQGYGAPLSMQGLERVHVHSPFQRALGGTLFGVTNDVGVMFSNPAALHTLRSAQLSVAGSHITARSEQTQHYAPLKYYSNFSLLMEGLTRYIPNPDTSLPGVNAGDTVQRPFDSIGPHWQRSKNRTFPVEATLGVPFAVADLKMALGVGVVEYADMNFFYQNTNVLSPSILSQRPIPTPRPPNDSIPTIVRWWQNMQVREGTLRGYGGAISAALSERFSLGISGLVIRGSTNDFEQQRSRGRLTFYTNFFRLDSLPGRLTKTGTSDFRGTEFTISGMYSSEHLSFGFSLKSPMSLIRSFSTTFVADTGNTLLVEDISGEEKMSFPWRGTIGLAIIPSEKLMLGLEYEVRPFASARLTRSDGTESRPWLSSSLFHFGVQYTPVEWLHLRGGMREHAEVFESEGNPLVGEPVTSQIYTFGIGITMTGFQLDLTYEYGLVNYQDVWGAAVSFNSDKRQAVILGLSYDVGRLWQ